MNWPTCGHRGKPDAPKQAIPAHGTPLFRRAARENTTRLSAPPMKALFLTNEFPPTIYGGAGVHVDYLSRELAKLIDVEVRCYAREGREPRLDLPHLKAVGYGADTS